MSCVATERAAGASVAPCVVVGFGNTIRTDDGLGPFVAAEVEKIPLGGRVRVVVCHQLEPDLVEDIREAGRVIWVDATAEKLADGRAWSRLEPSYEGLPYVSHTLSPDRLLGLLHRLYQRRPDAWLVSVQGDEFGFGEHLSPQAAGRARLAIADITEFVSKEE